MVAKLLKSPYLWTGILLFALFTFFSCRKQQQVKAEAQKRIKMMVQNVSVSNISIFKGMLFHYAQQLEYVKHTALSSPQHIRQTIDYFGAKDSLMYGITRIEWTKNNAPHGYIHPVFGNQPAFLEFIAPLQSAPFQQQALALRIGLTDLHTQIADNKSFSYAYLTLCHNNRYVFHPDESKIGKPVEAANRFIAGKDAERTVTEAYSDYLNIPVYRYHETVEMGAEKWIFTANVPGISFNEVISNTRNAFISLSVLASVAFASIFLLGILYWQREFLKRQQVQQEKITLELKNEHQKQQVLATELEQLKSGLNPHFLFNSLSSLKILVAKQPEEAKNFALALSNLYRYLLKQEKCDTISLQEELNFTKDYIYLQQIRFANRIQVEIRIDENAPAKKLPPMSLQLLVENCIKHTKTSHKQPLKIEIYTNATHLMVKNNYNPLDNEDTPGIGLENLAKRYSFLTSQTCSFRVVDDEFIAAIPLL